MAATISGWVLEKFQVRRLRQESRALAMPAGVVVESGVDHATFVLLRALHLERQLRVASLLRQREAMAGLARSIVEAALIGLYLTCQSDAPERMDKATRRHIERMMGPWAPKGLDPSLGWLEGAIRETRDSPSMPDLRQIARQVDDALGLDVVHGDVGVATYLYSEWFVPLSNLAVHTSLPSLNRHLALGRRAVLLEPWGILPRRGAIRAADGSIAYLASEIAKDREKDHTWLRAYAQAQVQRANVPIAVVLLQAAWGVLRHLGPMGVLSLDPPK